jgi:hypothetical protein
MISIQKLEYKVRLAITRYIHSILLFSGLLILFFLLLDHELYHRVLSLSHLEKYLYLIFVVIAIFVLLAALWTKTLMGRQHVIRLMRIPESEMVDIGKGVYEHFLGWLILLAAYAIAFVAYVDIKHSVYDLDVARFFNDTLTYLKTASLPFTDINFWSGQRSFTFPLFLKLSGYTFSNYMHQDAMERVSQYQSSFSIFSWGIFAFSFSLGMKHRFSKIISFAFIILIGASLYVTQWDHSMLSESVSTSFMVIFMAFLIITGLLWDIGRPISFWIQGFLLVLFFLATVLYVFSRDTNAYLLLALIGLMVIGLFFSSVRKHPLFRAFLTALTGFIVIFSLVNATIFTGKRSIPSLFHVVVYRVIPQQESLNYFIEHGMPYVDSYQSLASLHIQQLQDARISVESVQHLYAWLKDGPGISVIVSYLLSHPLYTLSAPLKDVQSWVNGNTNEWRKILIPTSSRIHVLSLVMYPIWDWLPILFLMLFFVCIVMIWKGRMRESIWFVIYFLFISAYPLAMLIWHTDTITLERHVFQVALQLRIASWMSIALLLDRVFLYLQNRKQDKANLSVKALLSQK